MFRSSLSLVAEKYRFSDVVCSSLVGQLGLTRVCDFVHAIETEEQVEELLANLRFPCEMEKLTQIAATRQAWVELRRVISCEKRNLSQARARRIEIALPILHRVTVRHAAIRRSQERGGRSRAFLGKKNCGKKCGLPPIFLAVLLSSSTNPVR